MNYPQAIQAHDPATPRYSSDGLGLLSRLIAPLADYREGQNVALRRFQHRRLDPIRRTERRHAAAPKHQQPIGVAHHRRLMGDHDRPRWRDYRRLGLLRPAGVSKWQIPVLTLTDRTGARRADMLPDRRAQSLVAVLDRHVGPDADGDGAFDLFARARALPHYRLNPKTGPRVIRTAFHLQTINNLHSRFESFMKPFCGPATKNLPGYAAWFITRLIGDETAARGVVWQRLLAA